MGAYSHKRLVTMTHITQDNAHPGLALNRKHGVYVVPNAPTTPNCSTCIPWAMEFSRHGISFDESTLDDLEHINLAMVRQIVTDELWEAGVPIDEQRLEAMSRSDLISSLKALRDAPDYSELIDAQGTSITQDYLSVDLPF